MITEAERRYPVRIRVAVPEGGLGERLSELSAWLDENCGADGWALTPSGLRGVVNDAFAVYFAIPRSRAPLSRDGAPGRSRRVSTAPFGFGRMDQADEYLQPHTDHHPSGAEGPRS